MLLREWMVPHAWMVRPTPQTEWIERRGILVWIAEVFGSLGPGLYLVSLFYNNLWGMFIAWLVVVFLKIPPHMVYFGKPSRFWRVLPPFSNAWRTSWMARGVLFTILFIALALLQIVLTYFLLGTGWDIVFKVVAGTAALAAGVYSGFVFSYCRSVPFWNSALLPLVFLFNGIADGFALIMVIGLAGGQVDITSAEAGSRILLSINAIMIIAYLWNAVNNSNIAKYSATILLRGRLAVPFWLGLVACGIVIPLVISIFSYFIGETIAPLLVTAIVLHTIGTITLKYCLLKAGIHSPIIPVAASNHR